MKIKLTEKFAVKRKGDVVNVDDFTAEQLIKEGKATAVAGKATKEKEVKEAKEEPKEEPATDAKDVVIE